MSDEKKTNGSAYVREMLEKAGVRVGARKLVAVAMGREETEPGAAVEVATKTGWGETTDRVPIGMLGKLGAAPSQDVTVPRKLLEEALAQIEATMFAEVAHFHEGRIINRCVTCGYQISWVEAKSIKTDWRDLAHHAGCKSKSVRDALTKALGR